VDISTAVKTLSNAMKKDYYFAWTWHCAMAMAVYDEGLANASANKAAERFMSNVFGVDTSMGNAPLINDTA